MIEAGDMSGDLVTLDPSEPSPHRILSCHPYERVGLHAKSPSGTRAGDLFVRGSNFDDDSAIGTWPGVPFLDFNGVLVQSLPVSAGVAFDELIALIWEFQFLAVTYTDSTAGAGVGTLNVSARLSGGRGRG
jgi:hypothetical protein